MPPKTYSQADTVDALERFVTTASAGDRCTYHVGELARDRDYINGGSPDVHRLATYASALAEAGLVILTQKRLREDACVYIAVRTSAPVRSLELAA